MNRPTTLSQSPIRFGVFEFNAQTGELRKQGLKIKLVSQASTVLSLLLDGQGEIRTREELQKRLWPNNTFVDFERSLYKAIHELRKALGDRAVNPRYIETVTSQGYRFIPIPQEQGVSVVNPKQSDKIGILAVLPLAGETADLEMELLNKRIIERVIDATSRTPGLRVLAYSSVQHCREKDLDPRTEGQNLFVQMVVAGEMVRQNDVLLLHLELIDVGDGTQLWGALFKKSYSEMLARPEKLADRICDQLRPVLTSKVSQKRQKK